MCFNNFKLKCFILLIQTLCLFVWMWILNESYAQRECGAIARTNIQNHIHIVLGASWQRQINGVLNSKSNRWISRNTCVCARVDVDGVGGVGEIVVLFTQLALSLEIGFSNAKFDRIGIGIEMRKKNIKLHATQYNIHSFIRSIRMPCISGMNLSHYTIRTYVLHTICRWHTANICQTKYQNAGMCVCVYIVQQSRGIYSKSWSV